MTILELHTVGGRMGNDATESRSEVSQICRQTEGVACSLRAVGAIEGHWGTLNNRGAYSNLAAARWKLNQAYGDIRLSLWGDHSRGSEDRR